MLDYCKNRISKFELINIDKNIGLCKKCNKKLNKFEFNSKERSDILKILEDMQKTNKDFAKIIDFIKKNPVKYVIDGANIGFQHRIGDREGVLKYFNDIEGKLEIIPQEHKDALNGI